MITRTARARYEGMGKSGKGWVSTQSGVLKDQRYGFGTRFENEPGTNPEELIAAAHASCFTMALSFALPIAEIEQARSKRPRASSSIRRGGLRVTRSDLELSADVPGLDEAELKQLAEDAKANCPISKLLKAEMSLDIKSASFAA